MRIWRAGSRRLQKHSPNQQLRQADQHLLQIADAQLAEAARLAGAHLHCHAGCAVCCFGPFLITGIDVWRLRLGLEEAPTALAVAIRQRAAAVAAIFEADPLFPLLHEDDDAQQRFIQQHQGVACPALDPDSGHCQLYAHRPLACRTYGPPTVLDGAALPPCPLCFKGATAADVEAARVTIDPGAAAEALLLAANAAEIASDSTLIALALR